MLRIPQSQQLLYIEEKMKLPSRWGGGGVGRWVSSKCISEDEGRLCWLMQYDKVGVWKDHGHDDAFFTKTKGAVMQSAGKSSIRFSHKRSQCSVEWLV